MSFTANFKLAQKGIILVAFPLACELIFVSFLMQLLHQSELQRAESEHARTLIAESDRLVNLFYEAATALVPTGSSSGDNTMSRATKHYSDILKKIPEQYSWLKELAKNHPDEEAGLARIAPLMDKGQRLLFSIKQNIDSADQPEEGMVNALSALGHKRKSIFSLLREVQSTLGNVNAPAKEIERLSPAREQANADHIFQTLLVGIALNIAVALILARYFSQSIVDRLNTVMENTHRVARELPLQSPVGGSDEIATLDGIFHEMAETVVETRKRERAVVDNVLDIICSLDSKGRFSSINNACKTVWGYEAKEFYVLTIDDLILPEQKQPVRAALQRIKREGTGSFECQIQKIDGAPVEMLWSASYSPKDDSFFCVAHDVSAQRRVERLKKQFVAMISHDLRTPLNSVLNLLTLVGAGAYGSLDETGERRIIAAEQDIERLMVMINELLQLEKLEAGKLGLSIQDVKLDRLIERSLISVESIAQKKKIRIQTAESGLTVKADEPRIIQVLVNLISNAIKASEESQDISITTQRKGDLGIVSVIDLGYGIPPEMQRKIFEPFEQVDSSQDGVKSDGFGLGLAISKQIIEQHGGKLTVLSEPNRGATFSFSLPIANNNA